MELDKNDFFYYFQAEKVMRSGKISDSFISLKDI